MAQVKPMKGMATYADYEDADSWRIGEMKTIIEAYGGTVVGESGGEEDNEYRIAFRFAIVDEYNRIEASGAEVGWEVEWVRR